MLFKRADHPEGDGYPWNYSTRDRWWRWLLVRGALLVVIAMPFVAFHLLTTVFVERSTRSPMARVWSDMRSMETGIESYFVDNGVYPAHTTDSAESFLQMAHHHRPTFRLRNGTELQTLTTPMAYVMGFAPDPFGMKKEQTFCYYAANGGWIMWSPGPDRIYDIDPEHDYDPTIAGPMGALLEKSWDPTNGTVSGGDIWRIRE